MNRKLLLVGGGGHCKSILDSLLSLNEYEEIGIVDKKECFGKQCLGVTIVGSDDDLRDLFLAGYTHAFISIGSIGDSGVRIRLYQLLKEIGFIIPNIIDPTAIVSKYVFMGEGVFVGKKAVVNATSIIGKCVIINSSVTIEHDCEIMDFAHVATGAVLCGGVKVFENTHIGANSTIKQGVTIGPKTLIGMGSVVLNNIRGGIVAYGIPCKEVNKT